MRVYSLAAKQDVILRGCEAISSSTAVIARLDRAIQYAAAPRFKRRRLWNTGSPACAHARVMTLGKLSNYPVILRSPPTAGVPHDSPQGEGRLHDFWKMEECR